MKKIVKIVVMTSALFCLAAGAFAKPISVQRQDLINCALELLGTPYVWGGKTPEPGIDCSGLIAFTSRKGIKVNFTGNAQTMYNSSSIVNKNQREPGDLLFFSETYTDSNITHVALYLGKYTGPGKFHNKHIFIHSANENTGVIISSIDDKSYWTQHYMGCGRYLPSSATATRSVRARGKSSIESTEEDFKNDEWWDDVDTAKWFED